MKQFILLIFAIAFLFSCGSAKTESSVNSDQTPAIDSSSSAITNLKLNPGDFISKINCPGTSDQSFALYVPSGFIVDKKIPAIFLFDPHGDGSLPLKLYRNLADQYGYFLIASNNSKNGNAKDLTADILQNIVQSGFQLLPLDSQRIYAAGFSGGGRVASMLAFSPAKFTGLITCGAGFPGDVWTTAPPSIVIGIAGNADMNLDELEKIKISNAEMESRFQLIRFEGKHEWPPVEIFEQALLAIESAAMRDKLRKKDDDVIKQIDNIYRGNADNLAANGKLLLTAGIYERWIKSLDGMVDLEVLKDSYRDMLRKPAYQQALREDQSLFAEEAQRKQVFIQAFGQKDTVWWQQQMSTIHKEIKTAALAKQNMLSRLTGTLSLMCFMNLNQSLSSSNTDAALYLSTLYKAIDPVNSEAWYLAAVVAAKFGKNETVINYLNKAVETGFKDKSRIFADPSFAKISNDPAFMQVINKI